ncbi:MAG: GNAT family protein [Nanoarchaeota archaeon]|nr:GNAT family protein [Nanoarchaeota archaeon]
MELQTQRLKLREIVPSDLEDLMETYNNLSLTQYLYLSPYPLTQEETRKFISQFDSEAKQQPRTDYNLGIEFNGKVIGLVQLLSVDKFQETAFLGYSLNESYWRRAIITEAVNEVIKFSFQRLNLRRIDCEIAVENIASKKVAEKLGFSLEGTRIKYRKMKSTGKIHDVYIYGLLNDNKE